jgi:hypothetical protein
MKLGLEFVQLKVMHSANRVMSSHFAAGITKAIQVCFGFAAAELWPVHQNR